MKGAGIRTGSLRSIGATAQMSSTTITTIITRMNNGNPVVVHHDHQYVVPNDDYGYRQSYYQQQPYSRPGYDDRGYHQVFRRAHRRHRTALRVFFGG
jgi:hypothetical protein